MTPMPSLAGFTDFVRNQMGISTVVLPDTSVYLGWAYGQAVNLTNVQLMCDPLSYMLAVYNLGAATLLNIAQDLPDATPVEGSKPPTAFFSWTRRQLNLNSFVTGVITSTSDQGTSESMEVPDWVKKLNLAELQLLKTPWGQAYLGIAQNAGTLWGIS